MRKHKVAVVIITIFLVIITLRGAMATEVNMSLAVGGKGSVREDTGSSASWVDARNANSGSGTYTATAYVSSWEINGATNEFI
ncbi:MAG: hypothetical protein EHM12_12915, partial [Dehalococcoidia bacterium]